MERFIEFVQKWALKHIINFEIHYYKDSRAIYLCYENLKEYGEFIESELLFFNSLKESNAYLKCIRDYCKSNFLDYGITVKTIEFLH